MSKNKTIFEWTTVKQLNVIKNIVTQTMMPCITVDRKCWVEQTHICCLYVEVDHKIGHKKNWPKTTKFKWEVYYIRELQMCLLI